MSGIKALKADPDNQIVVGAIVAPPTPYTVAWVPEAGGAEHPARRALAARSSTPAVRRAATTSTRPGQTTTDGSFGDPAVRISQWVGAFGANGVTASICDGSYANAFSAIVNKIGAQLQGAGSAGGSGSGGSTGTGAAPPICPNGIPSAVGGQTIGGNSNSGLHNGGCDVAAARPTALSLGALLLALFVSWRSSDGGASQRAALPGAEPGAGSSFRRRRLRRATERS